MEKETQKILENSFHTQLWEKKLHDLFVTLNMAAAD